MNVDEMGAGRELDALVAERVMGRKVYRGPVPQPDVQLEDEGSTCFVKGYGAQPTTETCPYYSTDIKAAWEVVMKLNAETPLKLQWCFWVPVWSAEFGEHIAYAFDAPLAVCRAALKAIQASK